jgi:hypothetical protein
MVWDTPSYRILEHIWMSHVGFLLGSVSGVVAAIVINQIVKKIPLLKNRYSKLRIFMPWRSFVLGILLFFHFPIFLVIWRIDYGPEIGVIGTATYIFIFSMILTIEVLGKRKKTDIVLRLVSVFRTMSVLSVLLAYHYGQFYGGGLSRVVIRSFTADDFSPAFEYEMALKA